MPQTRILYTMLDIRNMLARIHKVPVSNVGVFDTGELLIKDVFENEYPVSDTIFVIQVDK